jgi:hypothetical protein
MTSIVLRFTGWAFVLTGVALLVATGDIAVALGTPGPMPASGASDVIAMTFWRQLTFIRMFGTAAIGLGAICLWCRGHLTAAQNASFVKVLAAVLALMCLMAQAQQTAIWSGNAGWLLVGLIAAAMVGCMAVLAINATRQTA